MNKLFAAGVVLAGIVLAGSVVPLCGAHAQQAAATASAFPAANGAEAEIRAAAEKLAAAFNAHQVDAIAGFFLEKAVLTDEQGNVYEGRQAIAELLAAFFTKFPDASLEAEEDALRILGPVAIEEGERTMSSKDAGSAVMGYAIVWAKTDQGWRIASLQDYAVEQPPTPRDYLQPLAWLVGEWVNEGSDARVRINYQWSEDGNYLLADFTVASGEEILMKSSQRIGWDPLAGQIRSWLFDSDGGFSQGVWAQVGDEWVVKSSAVTPDGLLGTATVKISRTGDDRYMLSGADRIIGEERADDFELVVTRRPPTPQK